MKTGIDNNRISSAIWCKQAWVNFSRTKKFVVLKKFESAYLHQLYEKSFYSL